MAFRKASVAFINIVVAFIKAAVAFIKALVAFKSHCEKGVESQPQSVKGSLATSRSTIALNREFRIAVYSNNARRQHHVSC